MTKPFRIGVAGPCTPRLFAKDLDLTPEQLPAGLGGTPVNHLVRAWLDTGYEVTLATLDPLHRSKTPAVYKGPCLTLTVGAYRPRHRARDAFRTERQGVTAGLMLARPDAISAHWSYEFALGAIATGTPTLVTVRDVPREIFRMQPSPYRAVRWLMHRKTMARAAQVAFNSPYTRARLGHERARTAVVLPNALPDAMFVLPDRKAPDPRCPRFVSVNNGFGVWKNVGSLLEAFALVYSTLRGASLELVGNGFEEEGSAHRWARERGLEAGVSFSGSLPYAETLARIAASDILVHPSLEESFGYTLIEAASVGTPVIAGCRSGAVPWVLADGRAGRLVDVTSPEELAASMLALVAEGQQWWALRKAAFDLAKERFSASRVAAAYVEALWELAR